jgi:DNA mismatch endonuclease (patch repair protein)
VRLARRFLILGRGSDATPMRGLNGFPEVFVAARWGKIGSLREHTHKVKAMQDPLSRSERSDLMRRVRQSGTAPELLVRRMFTRLGSRYRLRSRALKRRPDIVFSGAKVAVYVHGCFWHQHADCPASRLPRTRPEYWHQKLAANVERDARHVRELEEAGWATFTIWECETKKASLEILVRNIIKAVRRRSYK